jgi:hypothetical protein
MIQRCYDSVPNIFVTKFWQSHACIYIVTYTSSGISIAGTFNEQTSPQVVTPWIHITNHAHRPSTCTAGTFNNQTGSKGVTSCLPCLPGRFCSVEGMGSTPLPLCAGGYYCQLGCPSCPENRMMLQALSVIESDNCLECLPIVQASPRPISLCLCECNLVAAIETETTARKSTPIVQTRGLIPSLLFLCMYTCECNRHKQSLRTHVQSAVYAIILDSVFLCRLWMYQFQWAISKLPLQAFSAGSRFTSSLVDSYPYVIVLTYTRM